MECSMLGSSVHCLPEFAQIHVHWVGDAIQPSHPLLSPSPPAFNLSQHQGLFQWVSSLNQVAKVLELQHQSFQWIFRTDFLWDGLVWSPCSPRDSQETSPTPQFKNISSSALRLFYGPVLISIHDYWKNCNFDFLDNWPFFPFNFLIMVNYIKDFPGVSVLKKKSWNPVQSLHGK